MSRNNCKKCGHHITDCQCDDNIDNVTKNVSEILAIGNYIEKHKLLMKMKNDQIKSLTQKCEQYEKGIKQAINIINKGAKLMPLKQLSKWEGCRGYIEWYSQLLKKWSDK